MEHTDFLSFFMFLELQLGGFFSNRSEKKREAVKEAKKSANVFRLI